MEESTDPGKVSVTVSPSLAFSLFHFVFAVAPDAGVAIATKNRAITVLF